MRLTAKGPSQAAAEALAEPLVAEVRARLGDVVFSADDESLEEAVLRLLGASGRTLACAESLTGGGVGARLTSVPGASASFVGSAVVYTAEAKHRVLGVPDEVLAAGTVTEVCALAMATGAQRLFGADLAVALTGAAGPEPHDGARAGHDLGRDRRRRRLHARAWVLRARRARSRPPLGGAGRARSRTPPPRGRVPAGDLPAVGVSDRPARPPVRRGRAPRRGARRDRGRDANTSARPSPGSAGCLPRTSI